MLIVLDSIVLECTIVVDAVIHYATAPQSIWFQGNCGGHSMPTTWDPHQVYFTLYLAGLPFWRLKAIEPNAKVHRVDAPRGNLQQWRGEWSNVPTSLFSGGKILSTFNMVWHSFLRVPRERPTDHNPLIHILLVFFTFSTALVLLSESPPK